MMDVEDLLDQATTPPFIDITIQRLDTQEGAALAKDFRRLANDIDRGWIQTFRMKVWKADVNQSVLQGLPATEMHVVTIRKVPPIEKLREAYVGKVVEGERTKSREERKDPLLGDPNDPWGFGPVMCEGFHEKDGQVWLETDEGWSVEVSNSLVITVEGDV